MNKYFSYPNIELWNGDLWTGRISKTYPLVKWIGELSTPVPSVFPREKDTPVSECKSLPYYFPKTNSVDLPDIVASWKERGVHYECRSQGGVGWILMAPTKCMDDFSQKIPSLIVMLNNDIKDDPYWAMSTLAAYQSYNDMVAEQQDKAFNELYKTWQDAAKTFKVTKEFKNLKVKPSYVTKTTTAEPTTEAPSTEAPASEAETTTAAVK